MLPMNAFNVETYHSPSTIVDRLSNTTDQTSWMLPLSSKRLFWGRIGARHFKLVPIISYRNSFLPVIQGSLSTDGSGTHVRVMMRLHWGTTIFVIIWAMIAIYQLAVSIAYWHAGKGTWHAPGLPLFMLLFMIGLTCGGFWWEAPKWRAVITQLIKADE
jgi:hypothetical protein